jgi:hypothetical protein
VKNFARRVWILKSLNLRCLSRASSTASAPPPVVVVLVAGGIASGSGSASGGTSEGGAGGFSLNGGVETGAWVFVVAAGASALSACGVEVTPFTGCFS